MAAFSFTQGSARMPAGAYPLSLGRHMITPEDVAAGRAQELYELVSTFLGPLKHPVSPPRESRPPDTARPDPADAVAVCFVSIAAPDRDSPVTAAGLQLAAATLRETLETFGGYECKCPEPNKFTPSRFRLSTTRRPSPARFTSRSWTRRGTRNSCSNPVAASDATPPRAR